MEMITSRLVTQPISLADLGVTLVTFSYNLYNVVQWEAGSTGLMSSILQLGIVNISNEHSLVLYYCWHKFTHCRVLMRRVSTRMESLRNSLKRRLNASLIRV